jgi:hypothetical protein
MSVYLGDFRRGATVRHAFQTTTAAQAPVALAGSPVIQVYKNGDATSEVTTGVTLSQSFDSVTGSHELAIVTTDAFYVPGDYVARFTAGTVDSISVVGKPVCRFSIENRFQGEVSQATAQGVGPQAITLAAGEVGADDRRNGDFILIVTASTGAGQIRQVTTSTASSDVCGLDRAWSPEPTGPVVYRRFPGSLGNTVAEIGAGVLSAATAAPIAAEVMEIDTVAVDDIADGLLDRDMATGSDSGSTTVRTVRQALRALRNKVSVSGGTATITKEDDSTASWTAAVTGTPAVTSVDPAGP